MASTFGSLEIAKSGMMTYNAALQTTAHNVANIETKGYSKQVANVTSIVGNRTSLTVQGFGVEVASITRRRDEYYDTKYQRTQSILSKYETDAYYLNELQDYICGEITSDEKSKITDAFDEFCNVLSDLKGKPNDSTIRMQAVTVAQTFAKMINDVGTNLQQLQEDANSEIRTCVEQINAYADKIASLTRQINTVEAYGGIANDLRDQRTLMVDELAQYCNVKTEEREPANGIGGTQFYVYVNGGVLVDTENTTKLEIFQKDTYSSINDIAGCYDIRWEDGARFVTHSSTLGGKLQSLFEMRDGNNATIVSGTLEAATNNVEGNMVLTITDTNCNDVQDLNIPAHDGEITISNRVYAYDSFEVKVDDEGKFTYLFTMKSTTDAADDKVVQNALQNGYKIEVGEEVNAKGIPYYMAQLNEFVRTYSQEFNRIHNEGLDLNNEYGIDFFNGKVPGTGDNYVFTESVDGKDASFSSVAEANEDGTYTGSYYYLTALNFCVTSDFEENPNLIACKGVPADGGNIGNDNGDNLQRLTELKDNDKMFVHGAPDSFIQSLTSSLGVNAKKANTLARSQSDLLYAIDSNRKSVSGVDEDEEGSDMMIFQQMLFNQYKVLSVMNEVLDKLINQTAV